MFPVDLMYGFYTMHKENNRIDVAIVEASAITEDGGIIPGASVGGTSAVQISRSRSRSGNWNTFFSHRRHLMLDIWRGLHRDVTTGIPDTHCRMC